jgi:rhomboid protease GluP
MALNSLVIAAMGVVTVLAWQNETLKTFWVANRENVVDHGQLHRLIFSVFMHSDPAHFLSNAYMFGILGFLICGYFGPRIYFGLLFGLGTLVHWLSLLTYEPQVNLIGASGVVYVFAGFWLVMYVGIDRRFTIGARLIRAIGVGLVILFPSTIEPHVSYRAHAIGFAVGMVFAAYYYLKTKTYFRKFEIVKPDEPEEEELPKIPDRNSQTWH